MSTLRILTFCFLISIGAQADEPVAIVYSLTGKASVLAPDHRPLRRFERLPAGTILETGAESRLALAFMNGLRYELGGRSRVTLGPNDLASRTGPVRPLPRVPPFPHLSPIAAEDRPGPRAGAVRIRAERITGLYPRRGAAVLPGEILLRFQPVTGTRRYRIEVEDDRGRIVFQADTESSPVKVPTGTLRAGLGYHWRVRTLDRAGSVARGEADLIVLGDDTAQAREAAREILQAEGSGSMPLLAEIDRSLGLLLEAGDDLRAALAGNPAGPGLREALAEIEDRLEDER